MLKIFLMFSVILIACQIVLGENDNNPLGSLISGITGQATSSFVDVGQKVFSTVASLPGTFISTATAVSGQLTDQVLKLATDEIPGKMKDLVSNAAKCASLLSSVVNSTTTPGSEGSKESAPSAPSK